MASTLRQQLPQARSAGALSPCRAGAGRQQRVRRDAPERAGRLLGGRVAFRPDTAPELCAPAPAPAAPALQREKGPVAATEAPALGQQQQQQQQMAAWRSQISALKGLQGATRAALLASRDRKWEECKRINAEGQRCYNRVEALRQVVFRLFEVAPLLPSAAATSGAHPPAWAAPGGANAAARAGGGGARAAGGGGRAGSSGRSLEALLADPAFRAAARHALLVLELDAAAAAAPATGTGARVNGMQVRGMPAPVHPAARKRACACALNH